MRQNPKLCLQADEIGNRSNWTSVVVTGTYLELREPQYTRSGNMPGNNCGAVLRMVANPSGGRRDRPAISSMETVFFRIDIKSMSGLRAIPEAEEPAHQGSGH